MEKTVTLYYNTGLQPGDVLEDKAILDTVFESTKISLNNAIIKQERYLAQIRLEAKVETVDPVDYAKIGETCYWVTGYTMLNDDVAVLSLQMDGITTVGLSNIEIISGWCNRRCVTDDTPFSNTLDEPFTPTDHFRIEMGGELKMTSSTPDEFYDVVLSTFDLAAFNGIKGTASELWEAATGDETTEGGSGLTLGVFVPTIPPLERTTEYFSDLYGEEKKGTIPGTAAFIIDKVETALQRCHSLGLDESIVYSYTIPSEYVTRIAFYSSYTFSFSDFFGNLVDWITSFITEAAVESLTCNTETIDSFLSPTFGEYKNNKVFSGQYQKYNVMSIVSGNSATYDVEDILVNGQDLPTVQYKIGADLRYNGFPVIAPSYYKGETNTVLFGSVTGGVWQTSPIGVKGVSGYGTTILNQRQQLAKDVINSPSVREILDERTNMSKAGLNELMQDMRLGLPKSFYGAKASYDFGRLDYVRDHDLVPDSTYVNAAVDVGKATLQYALDRSAERANVSVPQLMFSQVPNLQAYLGNRFYEYRVMLSESDMQRFDRFLTMFGYAVSEPLTDECFHGRKFFNYVKAEGVNIKADRIPLSLRRLVVSQIEQGVRIWHTAPIQSAFDENPILEA